jgi:glycine cleavage system H lipoate-binding protein
MKKRIEFRACTNDYRCGNCEFDQYFNDQYKVHTVVKPVDAIDVKGFKFPQGFYLHRGHAWLKLEEGSTVRIGFDDFIYRIMGPFDQVNMPLMGKEIKQNKPDITLRRGEKKAALLSPVSGIVTDINTRFREKSVPMTDQSPYSEGWIIRVHTRNLRQEVKKLLIGNETKVFLEEDVESLYRLIEDKAPLAADGGFLGHDIYGNLPELGWENLQRLFLRT